MTNKITINNISYEFNTTTLTISGYDAIDSLFPGQFWYYYRSIPYNILKITILGRITVKKTPDFSEFQMLKYIDLDGIDFSQLNSIKHMFFGCKELKAISFEHNNLKQIKNIRACFFGCSSLESITFGINGPKALEDCNFAFSECKKLRDIDLKNINFSAERDVTLAECFSGCKKIRDIDFSQHNLTCVKTLRRTFFDCEALQSIRFGEQAPVHLENVTEMCTYNLKLEIIDMGQTHYELNCQGFFSLLSNKRALTYVNLGDFTPIVDDLKTYIKNLLLTCPYLKSINNVPLPKINKTVHLYHFPMLIDTPDYEKKTYGKILKTLIQIYGGITLLYIEQEDAYYKYKEENDKNLAYLMNKEDVELFF